MTNGTSVCRVPFGHNDLGGAGFVGVLLMGVVVVIVFVFGVLWCSRDAWCV